MLAPDGHNSTGGWYSMILRMTRTKDLGVCAVMAVCGLILINPRTSFAAATPNKQADVVQTVKGPLKITPLYHGSVMLEFGGKIIHIDPWSQADYSGIPPADLILITHTHADHMDPAMIKMLRKESTVVLTPPAVADTLNGAAGEIETISNGEKRSFLGVEIEAIPMYNLVLGSAPGKPFHHKGIGNGYVLSFGDTRVYFSGDTECVPEMKALRNISIAFIAMNPPRTMPTAEAAACVKEFHSNIVYAYHYRGQNTQEFANALKNTPGIEVRLRKLEGEP
jgi:L-ascorbate metabolism protein UlaG (beta-lactamase superfamily)